MGVGGWSLAGSVEGGVTFGLASRKVVEGRRPASPQSTLHAYLWERLESLLRAVLPMRRFRYPSVTTVITSSYDSHSTDRRSLTKKERALASHFTARVSFVRSSKS